uniref:biotin/lipoyl-binding protein n=1 Tax=Delftia acidovorans TaxID=80866 RepID=UPI0035BBE462
MRRRRFESLRAGHPGIPISPKKSRSARWSRASGTSSFRPRPSASDEDGVPGGSQAGRIAAVHCKAGKAVAAGDALMVLEASQPAGS